MVLEMVGVGSQYALAATDAKGQYLDGSQNYKLTIPKDVPAKDFWSLVVYDPQTRSMLQTEQPYPSKNNERNRDMQTMQMVPRPFGLDPKLQLEKKPTGSRLYRERMVRLLTTVWAAQAMVR